MYLENSPVTVVDITGSIRFTSSNRFNLKIPTEPVFQRGGGEMSQTCKSKRALTASRVFSDRIQLVLCCICVFVVYTKCEVNAEALRLGVSVCCVHSERDERSIPSCSAVRAYLAHTALLSQAAALILAAQSCIARQP